MKYNLLISTLLICITIEVEKKDYLKEAAHWVDIVYNKIYDSECVHESPTAKTFEEIPQKKTISCSASASITYQQAGLIAKGKKVSHTASIGKKDKKSYYDNSNLKKSLLLSFTHAQNLKKGTCDFVKVMKHYDEMPDWLKQKGIMYVQDSNICVSAGKGKIYSFQFFNFFKCSWMRRYVFTLNIIYLLIYNIYPFLCIFQIIYSINLENKR